MHGSVFNVISLDKTTFGFWFGNLLPTNHMYFFLVSGALDKIPLGFVNFVKDRMGETNVLHDMVWDAIKKGFV